MVGALAGAPAAPDVERVRSELEEARGQLAELAQDYWGNCAITRGEFLAARSPQPARAPRASDELPLTGQHAVVAAMLDHLVVQPARRGYNRFDPERFNRSGA